MTAVLDGTPDALAADLAAGSARPALAQRYPARPAKASWAATRQGRGQVMDLADTASSDLPESRVQNSRRRGLPLLLDWLEEQPGQTWQDRWLTSGADDARGQWGDLPARWLWDRGLHSKSRLELMTSSLLVLVGADVIRPSLGWLLTGGRKRKLARNMIRARDPEGFARLSRACDDDPGITSHARKHVLFRVSVIIAAKGGAVADITIGDVLEILSAEDGLRGKEPSGPATFRALRETGIFGDGIPTLREIRDAGQRTVGELVDRYPLACRPVRDLIVDYLRERQPSIDYVTLKNRAYELARCFWADLEQHHPGIDSLRLSPEMAAAWKRRLRTRAKTVTSGGKKTVVEVERLSCLDVMSSVRCFYLDLAEWALQDPARWGPWVAPSPVSADDLDRRKAVRRRKARMDARTRDRLPVLPVLVSAAAQRRKDALALLQAGRQARPGEEFTAAGQTLIRSVRPHASPGNIWAHDPAGGPHRLLNREEEHAFWAWASIEVLRMTGCRAEELTELSHHSLVQYRLPGTGEVVPLLQIAPSKTDMERLILVSPELGGRAQRRHLPDPRPRRGSAPGPRPRSVRAPLAAAVPAAVPAAGQDRAPRVHRVHGQHPARRGVALLTAEGAFLRRDDFTSRFITTGTSISDGTTLMADIDWDAAITALQAGEIPCSGGERRILMLSASLAGGIPVDLRDAATGLDDRNVQRLVTAILHASGKRPAPDYIDDHL